MFLPLSLEQQERRVKGRCISDGFSQLPFNCHSRGGPERGKRERDGWGERERWMEGWGEREMEGWGERDEGMEGWGEREMGRERWRDGRFCFCDLCCPSPLWSSFHHPFYVFVVTHSRNTVHCVSSLSAHPTPVQPIRLYTYHSGRLQVKLVGK